MNSTVSLWINRNGLFDFIFGFKWSTLARKAGYTTHSIILYVEDCILQAHACHGFILTKIPVYMNRNYYEHGKESGSEKL